MKITKKDIVAMVGMIKANYTHAYKDITKNELAAMVEFWYTSLAKYEKEVVSVAFQRAVESCTFPPTLADIMKNIKEFKDATGQTDLELWSELLKSINEVGKFKGFLTQAYIWYCGERVSPSEEVGKIYDRLQPILKAYVGSPRELVNLARQETLEYEKGRFIKAIQDLKPREEIQQTIHPNVLRLAREAAKELPSDAGFRLLKDTE